MSTITKKIDTKCPGCQKEFQTAVDLPEVVIGRPAAHEHDHSDDIRKGFDEIRNEIKSLKERPREVEQKRDEPAKEDKPKEIVKEVMKFPNFMPYEPCKGDACGGLHKNSRYTQRVTKKCANGSCGQFAPEEARACPWCAQKDFDRLSKEDLDDAGIPMPATPESENDERIG